MQSRDKWFFHAQFIVRSFDLPSLTFQVTPRLVDIISLIGLSGSHRRDSEDGLLSGGMTQRLFEPEIFEVALLAY
jgi:hypothetical protein